MSPLRFGRQTLQIALIAGLLTAHLFTTPALGAGPGNPGSDNQGTGTDREIAAAAKTLFEEGVKHTAEGKFDLALKKFLAAKAIGVPRKSIQMNIARLYKSTGQMDLAMEAFTELITTFAGEAAPSGQELKPEDLDNAEREIADCCGKLLDSSSPDRALHVLTEAEKVVRSRMVKATIRMHIGRAYLARQDFELAFRVFKDLQFWGLAEIQRKEVDASLAEIQRSSGVLKGWVRTNVIGSMKGTIRIQGASQEARTIDRDQFGGYDGVHERPGKYRIEFSEEGYVTETRDIEIRSGEVTSVGVILRTPLEHALASAQQKPKSSTPYRSDESDSSFSGVRNHDGFYMRLALGAGKTYASLSANGESASMRGGSVPLDFAFGWSAGPVILGLSLGFDFVSSPRISTSEDIETDGFDYEYTNFGGFLDYFPNPRKGLHFGASLAMVFARAIPPSSNSHSSNTDNDVPPGVALSLSVGYDIWISNEWSLGATLRGMFIHCQDDFKVTHSALIPSVLLSFLYN